MLGRVVGDAAQCMMGTENSVCLSKATPSRCQMMVILAVIADSQELWLQKHPALPGLEGRPINLGFRH